LGTHPRYRQKCIRNDNLMTDKMTKRGLLIRENYLLKKLKLTTFDIECNRRLYGPLVSMYCTHVHSIITDCRILDMKSSFDD